MEATIMFGQPVVDSIYADLKERLEKLNKVKLVVVQVGEDPASTSYIKSKKRACDTLGIEFSHMHYDTISTENLLKVIDILNTDKSVTGYIVQLPLPSYIDENRVLNAIKPMKDVDGFHPENVGKMFVGDDSALLPCTPKGIIKMLKFYDIEMSGKKAVVVGRSNIVGKPMAQLLLKENATVTICHSRTDEKDLFDICRDADIIVCAVGIPQFLRGSYVKEGAVVVDVGIHRTENGLCGDVDFHLVKHFASYITPVPKGVGLLTVASLMENLVSVAEWNERNVQDYL